jgi:hypothetical protein
LQFQGNFGSEDDLASGGGFLGGSAKVAEGDGATKGNQKEGGTRKPLITETQIMMIIDPVIRNCHKTTLCTPISRCTYALSRSFVVEFRIISLISVFKVVPLVIACLQECQKISAIIPP